MQDVQTLPPRAKRGVLRALLLIGMGLMIPCYLFTVGNVALSPWPLYERNRLALAILTPLCLALLLLLRRAAKAACFERHERAVLLGFAAFYFAAQMLSAFALRFTPMTDLEQCVSAARRLLDADQPGLSERSLIYLGRNPHNMGVIYLFCAIFRAADLLGADQLLCAALVCSLLFTSSAPRGFAGVWAARKRRRGRCCCLPPACRFSTAPLSCTPTCSPSRFRR